MPRKRRGKAAWGGSVGVARHVVFAAAFAHRSSLAIRTYLLATLTPSAKSYEEAAPLGGMEATLGSGWDRMTGRRLHHAVSHDAIFGEPQDSSGQKPP